MKSEGVLLLYLIFKKTTLDVQWLRIHMPVQGVLPVVVVRVPGRERRLLETM